MGVSPSPCATPSTRAFVTHRVAVFGALPASLLAIAVIGTLGSLHDPHDWGPPSESSAGAATVIALMVAFFALVEDPPRAENGRVTERRTRPGHSVLMVTAETVEYVRSVTSPNILLIMTDEERYPPPYETAEVAEFRRTQMPARERLRSGGLELHRHYAGSTACVPSRATLFTGQYPSLHGVSKTDGIAKQASDPAMGWLDPDEVPTLGDWFRAGGYQTHYRGKWHVSHADLSIPGSHEGVMASDDDGRPIADAVEAYRKADRLEPVRVLRVDRP